MQEMPLERNQNLQNSQFHGGPYPQNPLEACALGTCVSTFMVLKNTPYFSSKGVGISICTCNWARDVKKYLNYNQKHFDCQPLPG